MIWVCEQLQNICRTRDNFEELSRSMVVCKFKLLHFSMIIGRRDVFHAGARYEDAIVLGYCKRDHMYFVPLGYKL